MARHLRAKGPTLLDAEAKHREVVPRYELAEELLPAYSRQKLLGDQHIGEDTLLTAERFGFGHCKHVSVACPILPREFVNPVWFVNRQRVEDIRIKKRKERSVQSQPKSDSGYYREKESGTPDQAPKPVSNIGCHRMEPTEAPRSAAGFLHFFDTVHFDQRRPATLGVGHPVSDLFVRQLFHIGTQFILKVGFDFASVSQTMKERGKTGKEIH